MYFLELHQCQVPEVQTLQIHTFTGHTPFGYI